MPEDIGGNMLKAPPPPEGSKMKADIAMDPKDLRYVSGYIFPFHFTHPVTGKPTSEAKLNARLKPIAFGIRSIEDGSAEILAGKVLVTLGVW